VAEEISFLIHGGTIAHGMDAEIRGNCGPGSGSV
jgi:hypothetical protein